VPNLTAMDETGESAAWRELEAAVDAALWHYAETVTGYSRDDAEQGGPLLAARQLHPGAAVGGPAAPWYGRAV